MVECGVALRAYGVNYVPYRSAIHIDDSVISLEPGGVARATRRHTRHPVVRKTQVDSSCLREFERQVKKAHYEAGDERRCDEPNPPRDAGRGHVLSPMPLQTPIIGAESANDTATQGDRFLMPNPTIPKTCLKSWAEVTEVHSLLSF